MNNIDTKIGLTNAEVQKRIDKGLVNYDETPKTKTVKQIIKDNFFNYFNYLNLALGIAVFTAGVMNGNILFALKNCLFMGVIIINSIISIIEEVISKRITDKLSVMSESKTVVIRNSVEKEIGIYEIVKDEIIKLSPGRQIPADSILIEGELEVNESLLTGESDSINKKFNDKLLSGSFVVAGTGIAQVIHVGNENYASKITSEAKYKKKSFSVIMASFEKLLKILSVLIVPIGITMAISQYNITKSIPESIFTTVASLIGMIPEGLILLTSSVMAVGVMKLYRVKVLVQNLNAIEALARVDVICLDKTGTLTEGKMAVYDFIAHGKHTREEVKEILRDYANSSEDTNETIKALKEALNGISLDVTNRIPFSSIRKYSAIETDDTSIYFGAPSVIGGEDTIDDIEDYIDDYRVVAIGKRKGKLSDKIGKLDIIGYVLLEDVIRPSAKDTLNYFKNSNVKIIIISGDDQRTVTSIARKVGLDNVKGIDIGEYNDEQLKEIIDRYEVFGRVKPNQKKWIVKYLKSQGHTVAMTGDGVNDVLALKESDCAISVKNGTDAARNVSQLILLNNDFNSLPVVVAEGRQTVNNVERSASLLLTKTIYTILLILFSIVFSQKYFFIPIQLTLITLFTISTPSFILALEPNNDQIKGNFLLKILSRSLPAGLTTLTNIAVITAFADLMNLSYETQSTLCVLLTVTIGLIYLYSICRPFTIIRGMLFTIMSVGFSYCIIFQPAFFNLEKLNPTIMLIVGVLALASITIYKIISFTTSWIFHKIDKTIDVVKI